MEKILLFLVMAALVACTSSPRDAGQAAGNVHPAGWAATHKSEADTNGDHCKVCHGSDFTGGTSGVSCLTCHISGPPFTIHPWSSVIDGHKTFAQSASWTTCANANCHGADLRGGSVSGTTTGPSCFTAACHGAGPPAPHTTPYTDPADHGTAARSDLSYCRNCHGTPTNDFSGGMVADPNIKNNSNGNCASCHADATAHPTNWQGTNDDSDPTYDSSHRGVGQSNISENCALCHLTTGPGAGPMSGAPSCYSADFTNPSASSNTCHPNGPEAAPHTIGSSWVNASEGGSHEGGAISNGLAYCQECHGNPPSGTGASFNVAFTTYAQGCETCHAAGFADGYTFGSCASCHNKPPDGAAPAGNARPNRAGAHAAHAAISAIGTNCAICHNNAGHDSANHYDTSSPATVSFAAGWDENGTTASYNAGGETCSGVRCHGGKTTPAWSSGSIDLTSGNSCTNCHAVGGSTYNRAGSGKHDKHVNGESAACTECHDTTLLAASDRHFNDLGDTNTGADSAATIDIVTGNSNSGGGQLKYVPASQDCYLTCHAPFNKNHDPKSW